MKTKWLLIALIAALTTAWSDELPEDLEELKEDRENEVKIGGVSDDTVRNEADEELEEIKFYTYQNEDDPLTYRIRVTLELTDENDEIYFAQLQVGQGTLRLEYNGEDRWAFQVPHGDLPDPEISAYAIQYGFLKDGTFVIVDEEMDDTDSPEEIIERATGGRVDIFCSKHIYSIDYEDGTEIEWTKSNHESLR